MRPAGHRAPPSPDSGPREGWEDSGLRETVTRPPQTSGDWVAQNCPAFHLCAQGFWHSSGYCAVTLDMQTSARILS